MKICPAIRVFICACNLLALRFVMYSYQHEFSSVQVSTSRDFVCVGIGIGTDTAPVQNGMRRVVLH